VESYRAEVANQQHFSEEPVPPLIDQSN